MFSFEGCSELSPDFLSGLNFAVIGTVAEFSSIAPSFCAAATTLGDTPNCFCIFCI